MAAGKTTTVEPKIREKSRNNVYQKYQEAAVCANFRRFLPPSFVSEREKEGAFGGTTSLEARFRLGFVLVSKQSEESTPEPNKTLSTSEK